MKWLRMVRGALVMGLTWAVVGALVGGAVEFVANFFPALNVVDMWIPLFAMPAFVCGAVFSMVLAVAARSRRFEELSVGQFGLWGAIGGLVVSTLGMLAGLGGAVVSWGGLTVIVGAPALFSAVAASGTMALARRGGEKVQALPGEQS